MPKNMLKEEQLHRMVCEYIRLQYPKAIFNTDLSGVRLTKGLARKVSALRSSRAFPDLVIYEPRGRFLALFIELKRKDTRVFLKDGSLSIEKHIQEQATMINNLRDRGYYAVFACGFDEAVKMIDGYMRQDVHELLRTHKKK